MPAASSKARSTSCRLKLCSCSRQYPAHPCPLSAKSERVIPETFSPTFCCNETKACKLYRSTLMIRTIMVFKSTRTRSIALVGWTETLVEIASRELNSLRPPCPWCTHFSSHFSHVSCRRAGRPSRTQALRVGHVKQRAGEGDRPHTSHLTPYTSHLTPHTSHLTPHTSHLW